MIALLTLLLACGAREARPTEPAPPDLEAPASPTPAPAPTPTPTTSWVGRWRSPSCGERTYVRELTLAADGTWLALELVAPCPPGAMCVWAGVVEVHGTWAADGAGITLTEPEQPTGPARARPTRLDPDPEGLRSTEPDGACLYTSAAEQPVEEGAKPVER